jgi:hypothetical protein
MLYPDKNEEVDGVQSIVLGFSKNREFLTNFNSHQFFSKEQNENSSNPNDKHDQNSAQHSQSKRPPQKKTKFPFSLSFSKSQKSPEYTLPIPTNRTENISDHLYTRYDKESDSELSTHYTIFDFKSNPDARYQRSTAFTMIAPRDYYRLFSPLYSILNYNAPRFVLHPFPTPKLYFQKVSKMIQQASVSLIRVCLDTNISSYPFTAINAIPPSVDSLTNSNAAPHPFTSVLKLREENDEHNENNEKNGAKNGAKNGQNLNSFSATNQASLSRISSADFLFTRFMPYSYPFVPFITHLCDVTDPLAAEYLMNFFKNLQICHDFGFIFRIKKIKIYIILTNSHIFDSDFFLTLPEVQEFVDQLPFENVCIKQCGKVYDWEWLQEEDEGENVGGKRNEKSNNKHNNNNNNLQNLQNLQNDNDTDNDDEASAEDDEVFAMDDFMFSKTHQAYLSRSGEPYIIHESKDISITQFTKSHSHSNSNLNHFSEKNNLNKNYKIPRVPPIKLLFFQIILEEYLDFLNLEPEQQVHSLLNNTTASTTPTTSTTTTTSTALATPPTKKNDPLKALSSNVTRSNPHQDLKKDKNVGNNPPNTEIQKEKSKEKSKEKTKEKTKDQKSLPSHHFSHPLLKNSTTVSPVASLSSYPNTWWDGISQKHYLNLSNHPDLLHFSSDNGVTWRNLPPPVQRAYRQRDWIPLKPVLPLYYQFYKKAGYSQDFSKINLQQIVLSQALVLKSKYNEEQVKKNHEWLNGIKNELDTKGRFNICLNNKLQTQTLYLDPKSYHHVCPYEIVNEDTGCIEGVCMCGTDVEAGISEHGKDKGGSGFEILDWYDERVNNDEKNRIENDVIGDNDGDGIDEKTHPKITFYNSASLPQSTSRSITSNRLDVTKTIPSTHHYYSICWLFALFSKDFIFNHVTDFYHDKQFFNSPNGLWQSSLSKSVQTTYHNIKIENSQIPSVANVYLRQNNKAWEHNLKIFRIVKPSKFPIFPATSMPIAPSITTTLPTMYPLNSERVQEKGYGWNNENGGSFDKNDEQNVNINFDSFHTLKGLKNVKSIFNSTTLRSSDESIISLIDKDYECQAKWGNTIIPYFQEEVKNYENNNNKNIQNNSPKNTSNPSNRSELTHFTITIDSQPVPFEKTTGECECIHFDEHKPNVNPLDRISSSDHSFSQNTSKTDRKLDEGVDGTTKTDETTSQKIDSPNQPENPPQSDCSTSLLPLNPTSPPPPPPKHYHHRNVVVNTMYTWHSMVNQLGRFAPFCQLGYIIVLHLPTVLSFKEQVSFRNSLLEWNNMVNTPIHIVYLLDYDTEARERGKRDGGSINTGNNAVNKANNSSTTTGNVSNPNNTNVGSNNSGNNNSTNTISQPQPQPQPQPLPQSSSSIDKDSEAAKNFAQEVAKRGPDLLEVITKNLFETVITLSEQQIKKLLHIHVTVWEDLPSVITQINQSMLATRFDLLYDLYQDDIVDNNGVE